MDDGGNGASVKRLNTKGCCFLCLQIEDVTRTNVENSDKVTKSCSMHHLLRHLQINANFDNKILDSSARVDGQLIEVNFCKTCREINANVAKICQKLEKLQMELNYALESIHTQITDSGKDSDMIQEYSRRMTSDLEALSQLAFVDNLRKELARKCLKMRNGPIPIIQVTKYKKGHKRAFIKQEKSPYVDESDMEMNCDPPSSPSFPDYDDSEPSSPTPEEIKFKAKAPPEVLKQKYPRPSTSSSSAKQTLDVSSSSKTQSTSKNNLSKKKEMKYSKNETTGMFHCNNCSESYKSVSGVRWHYLSVHLHFKEKCKICGKMVDPSNILAHEKACRKITQRRLAKEKDPKFKFICNKCGSKFDTRKKLYDHEFHVHRNAKRYPCKLCDKTFNSPIRLKNHVDGVHLGKRVFCKFCNKSYACRFQMRIHEKKCTKESKIKLEPEIKQ